MINIEEVRDVFVKRIIDSSIFNNDDIQWENMNFNPEGKELWMTENIMPVLENFVSSDNDMAEYIAQYNISTPINNSRGSFDLNGKATQLGNLFKAGEMIVTDNYKTSVESIKKSFQGVLTENWFSIVIDVNFKVFS